MNDHLLRQHSLLSPSHYGISSVGDNNAEDDVLVLAKYFRLETLDSKHVGTSYMTVSSNKIVPLDIKKDN